MDNSTQTKQYIDQPVSEPLILPFIEANTIELNLKEIRENHIIPVFSKDNHPLISQFQFIELVEDIISNKYETFAGPHIRVSHPIKGRVPSARSKKAVDLLPHEITLYYERMMFVYLVPSVRLYVDGKEMCLVIGGVKSYNKDNLGRSNTAPQHFQIFIGFQVRVCSNLCVWTDGTHSDIAVTDLDALGFHVDSMIHRFAEDAFKETLDRMINVVINEEQFAHLIGKSKLYHHQTSKGKSELFAPPVNETQLSRIASSFYTDTEFGAIDGEISLWSLYNLYTNAIKTSYIDSYVSNNAAVLHFVERLSEDIIQKNRSWYILS